MGNLLLLIYFFIFLSSVLISGYWIIKFFRLYFSNKIEDLFFAFGLGSIVYSYVFIYLGIFHALYKSILLIVYLLPIVLFLYVGISRQGSKIDKKSFKYKLDNFDWLLLLALIFIFFPIIPKLFLFPTSWDPLAYHLTLPKLYLKEHALNFYYYFSQTAWPIGIESLYGFGEIFKDPRFGNLLNFTFLFAIIIYLLYGLDYLFEKKVLILAGFLFIFRPFIYTELSTTPFIDFGLTFFVLLLAISFIKFMQSRKITWLVILGILTFYLPMIKFSGFIISGSLIFSLVYYLFINKGDIRKIFLIPKNEIRKYSVVLIIFLLPLVYWFARNYIYAHNPVYPFLNNLFKGLNYDSRNVETLLNVIKNENLFYKSLIYNFSRRLDSAVDYSNLSDILTYALLLIISVFSIFRFKNFIRYISLFSFLSLIIITFLIGPLMRYYMPVLVVLVLIVAYSLFYSWEKLKGNFLYILIPVLIIFVFFTQIDSAFYQRTQFYTQQPKLLNYSYLNYSFDKASLFAQDNYRAINYVNTHLDKNKDRVLVLFDNRLYYYNVPVEFDDPTISGYFTNPNLNTAEQVRRAMRKEGITYVVINTRWGITPALKMRLYKAFVKKYLQKVYAEQNPNRTLAIGVFKLK